MLRPFLLSREKLLHRDVQVVRGKLDNWNAIPLDRTRYFLCPIHPDLGAPIFHNSMRLVEKLHRIEKSWRSDICCLLRFTRRSVAETALGTGIGIEIKFPSLRIYRVKRLLPLRITLKKHPHQSRKPLLAIQDQPGLALVLREASKGRCDSDARAWARHSTEKEFRSGTASRSNRKGRRCLADAIRSRVETSEPGGVPHEPTSAGRSGGLPGV